MGTVTEINDYMRLLWARIGIPYSPATGLPIESQTVSQMVDRVLALPERARLLFAGSGGARSQGRISQGNRRIYERGFQRLKIDGPFRTSPTRPLSIKNSSTTSTWSWIVLVAVRGHLRPACRKL